MPTHKDLEVWQRAIDLVTDIYLATKNFPKEEIYGLTAQIRRCVISVPSNIAEGAARQSNREYIQFLYIALGSLTELDTQIIIAKNIGLLSEEEINVFEQKIETVGKLLNGLINYRKTKN